MTRPEVVTTPYEDAIIDNLDPNVGLGYIYGTLQEVLTAAEPNIVAVFIRNMGDAAPATIGPGDLLQLVRGKDSDTTELLVNVTCSKDDVTFEQLKIPNGVTLTLAGARCIAKNILIVGTGKLVLSGDSCMAEGIRIIGATANNSLLLSGSNSRASSITCLDCTATPVRLQVGGAQLRGLFADGCSGTNIMSQT